MGVTRGDTRSLDYSSCELLSSYGDVRVLLGLYKDVHGSRIHIFEV